MRALLALSIFVFAVSCSGGGTDDHDHDTDEDGTCEAGTAFSISNFAFHPACVIVAPGATVTFTNNDSTQHTSTTNASQVTIWDSTALDPGDTFTTPTLSTVGTIKGHCNFHTSMHFEIRVE